MHKKSKNIMKPYHIQQLDDSAKKKLLSTKSDINIVQNIDEDRIVLYSSIGRIVLYAIN